MIDDDQCIRLSVKPVHQLPQNLSLDDSCNEREDGDSFNLSANSIRREDLSEHATNERLLPISANSPVKMKPSKSYCEEEKIESEPAMPDAASIIEEEKVDN